MIYQNTKKTIALLSRFFFLFLGTSVGMFAAVIVLIGIAGHSLIWLAAGAVIMLLSVWLIEQFNTKPNKSRQAVEDKEHGRDNR